MLMIMEIDNFIVYEKYFYVKDHEYEEKYPKYCILETYYTHEIKLCIIAIYVTLQAARNDKGKTMLLWLCFVKWSQNH